MYNKVAESSKRLSRIKELFKSNEYTNSFIESRKYAKDDEMNILITGETGTGKEVLAHYIHENSQRADKPFLTANIGAIPENLLQSDLFGHEKGSFTGAIYKKDGIFKAANGGTVFLDEIGDASPLIQVALLRLLDYGEIQTVGKDVPDVVNVRVITATNASLQKKINDKLFREDLYYRIAGASLHLEPLRLKTIQEKKEILNKLIFDTAKYKGINVIQLTESAWNIFLNHQFKGNFREARNIIERLYVEEKSVIDVQDINKLITPQITPDHNTYNTSADNNETHTYKRPLTLKEQNAIIVYNTLQKNKGVKNDTLNELDISFKTLNSFLSIYKTINNFPNEIGKIPIDNGKNSNSILQKT